MPAYALTGCRLVEVGMATHVPQVVRTHNREGRSKRPRPVRSRERGEYLAVTVRRDLEIGEVRIGFRGGGG